MSTFTNRIGQTLQPGDKVIAIAQCYSHSIKERSGIFVGVSPAGKPQVRVILQMYRWQKPDGTFGAWSAGSKHVRMDVERISTYHAGRVYKLA